MKTLLGCDLLVELFALFLCADLVLEGHCRNRSVQLVDDTIIDGSHQLQCFLGEREESNSAQTTRQPPIQCSSLKILNPAYSLCVT